jgi:hypothetical protein
MRPMSTIPRGRKTWRGSDMDRGQSPNPLPNPLYGFLQFVAVAAALYVIWFWTEGHLGYWAWPVALGISSIPALIAWLRKKQRKST